MYRKGGGALFSPDIAKTDSSQKSGLSSEKSMEGGMDALAGEDLLSICSQIRAFVRYTSGQNGKYVTILPAVVSLTAGILCFIDDNWGKKMSQETSQLCKNGDEEGKMYEKTML